MEEIISQKELEEFKKILSLIDLMEKSKEEEKRAPREYYSRKEECNWYKYPRGG
jgi:hypothetical protein